MEGTPEAKDMSSTYENFIAHCPWCGRENIFNRATDLRTFYPIDYLVVNCLSAECAKAFYLNGDVVNPAYEMIIFDCYELLKRKYYAYCILNLAQAFEVFFSQYLRVDLLYKPFARGPLEDIERLNNVMALLYDKTRKLSFDRMKNLFLSCVLDGARPKSLPEAEDIINGFSDKSPCPSDEQITNATISGHEGVRELLLRLKSCKVPEKRNRVVHQHAYRPTLDEVNEALKETREILFPLGSTLDVRIDDANLYRRKRT
jgi:hypothetical protein